MFSQTNTVYLQEMRHVQSDKYRVPAGDETCSVRKERKSINKLIIMLCKMTQYSKTCGQFFHLL